MNKTELQNAVANFKEEMRTNLQLIVDELNQGQQKKIVKDEAVKALLDRYGVTYSK